MRRYRNLEEKMLKQWLREVPANRCFALSLEGAGQEEKGLPCYWRGTKINERGLQVNPAKMEGISFEMPS